MSWLRKKLVHPSPLLEIKRAEQCPQEPKLVVAHFIVGNTAPYSLADWEEDIILASRHGIDGFALNVGKDDWQFTQVSSCFEAAVRSGTYFKLFLSFDMSSMPSSTSHDIQSLKKYILKFTRHAQYLHYRGKALVSTFAGENALYGCDDCDSAWMIVKDTLEEVCPIFFIPSFFIDPRIFRCMKCLDGAFNWNGCWPIHLTPESPPDEIRHPRLLSDFEYLHNLQMDDGTRKVYMAAVSPWFFTHYGRESWNKNWIYPADDWLLVRRWRQLIGMRDDVDIVQIISWNDYGESHYIGPIKGALPESTTWVRGFDHTPWLHLCGYFARIFKAGHEIVRQPEGSFEFGEDRIFVWARPHPRDLAPYDDQVGRPRDWELTEDFFWVVVLACEPATVRLRSREEKVTRWISAGLSLISCRLVVGGSISVLLSRHDVCVINFSPPDFLFDPCPATYNFNAYVWMYPQE